MRIKVLFFGKLSDIAGKELQLNDVNDLEQVKERLVQQFPALQHEKFAIAVDQSITEKNISLQEGSVVALLPPFSGG